MPKYGVIVKLTEEIVKKAADISVNDIEENNNFLGISFGSIRRAKIANMVAKTLGITEQVDADVWVDHYTDTFCIKIRSDHSHDGILPEVQEGCEYPHQPVHELVIGEDAR